MDKDPTQRDPTRANQEDTESLPPDEDEALLSVVGEFADGLKRYVDGKRDGPFDERLLGDYLAEGVFIAALKILGPEGDYRIDEGMFWLILQQYCPVGYFLRQPSEVQELVGDLFHETEDEEFEDGFDSALSLRLQQCVIKYGEAVVEAASDLILKERVHPEAAAEALRCLGEMEHAATYEARRRLLEKGLECSSHVTRDGAVIGLDDFDDPRSIPALEAAVAREEYHMLRDDMTRLLGRLRGKVVSP